MKKSRHHLPQAMWAVSIPASLKRVFSRQFPGRANMRRLTEYAIRWAIRNDPRFLNPEPNGNRQLRTNDAPSVPSKVRSPYKPEVE